MIQLGKAQKLQVVRNSPIGLYLNSRTDKGGDDILPPNNQVPSGVKIGGAW